MVEGLSVMCGKNVIYVICCAGGKNVIYVICYMIY